MIALRKLNRTDVEEEVVYSVTCAVCSADRTNEGITEKDFLTSLNQDGWCELTNSHFKAVVCDDCRGNVREEDTL